MMNFFDINNTFISILGTHLSYLEFLGGITSLIYVVLAAKGNAWNWPLVLISTTLTFFVFYQIQLYPDMFLQVFFFLTGLIGWWRWKNPRIQEADQKNELKISRFTKQEWTIFVFVGGIGTILLGWFALNLHELLPKIFSQPSARPFVDSFITVMSVITTYYVIQKKLESWIAWILVDLVATYLYYERGIKFYSANYLVFCGLAVYGYFEWKRILNSYSPE